MFWKNWGASFKLIKIVILSPWIFYYWFCKWSKVQNTLTVKIKFQHFFNFVFQLKRVLPSAWRSVRLRLWSSTLKRRRKKKIETVWTLTAGMITQDLEHRQPLQVTFYCVFDLNIFNLNKFKDKFKLNLKVLFNIMMLLKHFERK